VEVLKCLVKETCYFFHLDSSRRLKLEKRALDVVTGRKEIFSQIGGANPSRTLRDKPQGKQTEYADHSLEKLLVPQGEDRW
jgi:hypothetical protein